MPETVPEPAVVHDASPLASEVRTLPFPGDPPVIFTWPFTSSCVDGVEVPIPNLLLVLSQNKFAFELNAEALLQNPRSFIVQARL